MQIEKYNEIFNKLTDIFNGLSVMEINEILKDLKYKIEKDSLFKK